jgi:hypothetical protein
MTQATQPSRRCRSGCGIATPVLSRLISNALHGLTRRTVSHSGLLCTMSSRRGGRSRAVHDTICSPLERVLARRRSERSVHGQLPADGVDPVRL